MVVFSGGEVTQWEFLKKVADGTYGFIGGCRCVSLKLFVCASRCFVYLFCYESVTFFLLIELSDFFFLICISLYVGFVSGC